MTIEHLLAQSAWRLRAYFGSPDLDAGRVGIRCDSALCPVSDWLFFETGLLALVDAEWIILPTGSYPTPPVLARFTDLVDAARCAPDASAAADMRVSRQEALATLARAEAEADQHMLPVVAASVPRCDYVAPCCARCWLPAATPELHCFIEDDPRGSVLPQPVREYCRPFVGRLCDFHAGILTLVGGAPDSWWHEPAECARPARDVCAATI